MLLWKDKKRLSKSNFKKKVFVIQREQIIKLTRLLLLKVI